MAHLICGFGSVEAFPSAEMHLHGYFQARIPSAVLVADVAVLLAFAECAPCADSKCTAYLGWHADLCSKRSYDGGRTWGNFTVVVKNGSQPSLIYDVPRSEVVLNFNLGRTGDWPHGGQSMTITSTDAGASWGRVTPLPAPAALGQLSGPGVGLQLTIPPHRGRMLFIGWRDQKAGSTDGDVVWFSDDGGRSYSTASSPFRGGFGEAQMAETSNGTIVAVFRSAQTEGRGIAYSHDGGMHFSPVTLNSNLAGTSCQSSILRAMENGRLYFSAPSSLNNRSHGLVRSSKDGVTWSLTDGFKVNDNSFGYSCLTQLPTSHSGFIGLLWETTNSTAWDHQPTNLMFSYVPLESS